MERMNNPLASNTMLQEGIDPITNDLFTEALAFLWILYILNKAKSRNPNFNDELPVGLNFWGNARTWQGTLGESLSLLRVQQGGYNDVDTESLTSETGAGLSFHSKEFKMFC